MLQNKVIKKSNSLYAFNIIVIEKKKNAKKRMNKLCINYASLNKLTIPNRYLLSNINKILSSF